MSTATRSGRISKPPVRYEPKETVIDDYSDEDVDEGESCDEEDEDVEEDDDDDEEDGDEHGNLKGFVTSDDEESDEEA